MKLTDKQMIAITEKVMKEITIDVDLNVAGIAMNRGETYKLINNQIKLAIIATLNSLKNYE